MSAVGTQFACIFRQHGKWLWEVITEPRLVAGSGPEQFVWAKPIQRLTGSGSRYHLRSARVFYWPLADHQKINGYALGSRFADRPKGASVMGPTTGLSQLERLCEKFKLRCHWCRKECSYNSPEKVPRRDWLVNFHKGKNSFSNLVLACTDCFYRRHPEKRQAPPKPKQPPIVRLFPKRERKIYPLTDLAFIDRLVWLKTRGRCFYCKNPVTIGKRSDSKSFMVKDHYVPMFHNGADDHSNLVPACSFCDNLKNRTLPWNFVNRFTGKPLVCFPIPPPVLTLTHC